MFRFNEPTRKPSQLFQDLIIYLVSNKITIQGADWDPNNDEYGLSFGDSDQEAEAEAHLVEGPYYNAEGALDPSNIKVTFWKKDLPGAQAIVVESVGQFEELIKDLWEPYNPNI